MESLRARSIIAGLVILMGIIWIVPNFVNTKNFWWPSDKDLNMGLDIQGGLHLVMGVDVESVIAESSQRLARNLQAEMKEEGIDISSVEVTNAKEGEFKINLASGDAVERVETFLGERYAIMIQILGDSGTVIEAQYYESYLMDYQRRIIQQAIETIRNRVDEFGVSEPSITAQGDDRILVQLPGIQDTERAKQLINTAARLEFMLVSQEMDQARLEQLVAEAEKAGDYKLQVATEANENEGLKYTEYVARLNEDLKGKLPAGTSIYFERAENARSLAAGKIPYLLQTNTDLSGDSLDDASVGFDQYGTPIVNLVFNASGAQEFADLTGANVNRQLAIVLDRVVKSAPNLTERIGGGRAQITLGRGAGSQQILDEAKMIATSLRAGALPASLQQLEERTVGPTLGADSIEKAQFAGLAGAAIVILFMFVYYKAMGFVANICLFVNVSLVLALLTSLEATLTLPGIAGIALTVGMAVDANVIIYERIKEELRKGTAFRLAVKEGYARALSAIVDSNITTAATAVVLMYFGTGPVRGFAVTLLIGIGTTLFTGVFLSHLLTDFFVQRSQDKKLSI